MVNNSSRNRLLSKCNIDLAVWEAGKARAKELVVESAEVERRSTVLAWAWGDLSLEIAPERGTNRNGINNHLVRVLLDLWREEYEFPRSKLTLLHYRTLCRAWPRERRAKASCGVHGILLAHPDRFALIRDDLTSKEARTLAGRKAHRQMKVPSTALERASAVKTWSRSLKKIIDPKPSEEVINAVADAWYAVTEVVDQIGILDEMFAEYEESSSAELALAP